MSAMPIFRRFGSLRFALTLIASLAIILSVSTVFESIYGTPFAQKNFYTAHWFDFILTLFWVNIFCATWTRYPFKKRHVGFVITHIGILSLLFGALLTRTMGVEGQMTIYENETKDAIMRSGFTLAVMDPQGRKETFDLKPKASFRRREIPLPSGKKTEEPLFLSEVLDHAAETRYLIESPDEKPNPAIHLALTSDFMGFHEKFTLIGLDPDNRHADVRDVGPAHFVLKKNTSGEPQVSIVIQKPGSAPFVLDPQKTKSGTPLGNSDLTITDFHYYSHAKIAGNHLVDSPDDTPLNPAIEMEIADTAGHKEFHTKFLIFPEFASLRGGAKADIFHLKVGLEAESDEEASGAPSFQIFPPDAQNPSWRYEIYSSKGLLKKGGLKVHENIETGWRDIHVEVLQLFDYARVLRRIKPAGRNASGSFAARLTREGRGLPEEIWVTEDHPASAETSAGTLQFALEPVKAPLPFRLTLKNFRKKDYPGTSNPSSYESDVTLYDPAKKITLEKTIRMNEPLDYAGYRIFQSSYLEDPDRGKASVFTIAKNPGIRLIYGGGVVVLFGVLLLFYFHPFFNPKLR